MTKERLRKYQEIKREQVDLQQRLEEVEAALYSPKTQQPADQHLSGSRPEGSALENLASYHMDLQDRYKAKLAELAAEQLAIEQAIEPLDTIYRMLLRYRYIDGLKWDDVCDKMNYSWRQTHYLHGRALQQLRELTKDCIEVHPTQ